MSPLASLSSSSLLALRETAESGRGLHAARHISKDSLLFETDDIAASVVYREYRREACAQCFRYDGGRNLPLRNPLAGVSFCSRECHDLFSNEDSSIGLMRTISLHAAEGLKGKACIWLDDENEQSSRPTQERIADCWNTAEIMATRIRAARSLQKPTKAERRALASASLVQPLHDILGFLLSGVLCAAYEPGLWNDVLELASNNEPYVSTVALEMHIVSYHHLLACCPEELLPHITADNLRLLAQKSSHNIFNLWSQDLMNEGEACAAGGSECLGYGLFPAASYFNHSCAPNVRKRRTGRMWQFWADRDIAEGEELCITYLGGDEKEMSRDDRMRRLQLHWGFDCACVRCQAGAADGGS